MALLAIACGSMAQAQAAAVPCSSNVQPLPIKDPNALIGNELSRLDLLIEATRQSLEEQQKLRKKIVEYQKIQDAHLLHPHDNEILFRMIKSAHAILKLIQDNYLEHTFDPEFISELKVLAQVATKHGIPKP